MIYSLLDGLPLSVLFVLSVLMCMAAAEAGFRLGRRRDLSGREGEAPVGAAVGATLGLFGFVLAFTFSMAAARFDTRRQLVLDEANAIGTAYLRAELLPGELGGAAQHLLRDYVTVRLAGVRDPEGLAAAIARSEEIHTALWALVKQASERRGGPLESLFASACNDVIDVHEKRLQAGIYNRIPVPIWAWLYLVASLALCALGYHSGLSGPRRSLSVGFLALAFSGILILIADLDRPGGRQGLLQVAQTAMEDAERSMAPPAPAQPKAGD